MNIREPNGTPVERWCDECKPRGRRSANIVIELRYGVISMCRPHFVELAIALSLAVTEEHPEENQG